jgi:hypothetical protein
MAVYNVTTFAEAKALAHHLLDPHRDRVVVVTTSTSDGNRFYDPAGVHEEAGGRADVYDVVPGEVNLEFSRVFTNSRVSVFGGAARVYAKGRAWMGNYRAHAPLFFAYSVEEAVQQTRRIADRAVEFSYLHVPAAEPEHLEVVPAPARARVAVPSPAALVGGRVDTALIPVEPAPSIEVEEDAEPEVETGAAVAEAAAYQEQIRQLTEDLEVERFRRDQDQYEHQDEVRRLRSQLVTARTKAQPQPQARPQSKQLDLLLTEAADRVSEAQQAYLRERAEMHQQLREIRVENATLQQRLSTQAETHREQLKQARKTAKSSGAAATTAEAWTPDAFPDTDSAVRFAILTSWVTRIPAADKPAYPLPEYTVGPCFAGSLDRLDSGQQAKALRCVVDVLTDLARELPARRVHPLRSGDGTEDAPRTRADGAICFRANVEANTASARRLHYWKLPDGSIELSRVVLHDDMEP